MNTSTTVSRQHKESSPESPLLELSRDFKVPVGVLFRAFSTSDAIKIWWWPKGLYADDVRYDFRVGGHYFINMKGANAGGGGMTGDFEDILTDKRIVMTDQFADKNGKPVSAEEVGMGGNWPELVYITFEFEKVDGGKSRLKLSQQGIPNEMQKDCIQGWSQSFDKLEKYLSETVGRA